MNISNESLLKILAVAAVAYFLLSGSSTPEKFMYQDNMSLAAVPPSYIRMRQDQPGPGLHIRTRQLTNSDLSVNPMGNIMNSQYIGHHIRRDRRNNMLNSMMRGENDPMDSAGM